MQLASLVLGEQVVQLVRLALEETVEQERLLANLALVELVGLEQLVSLALVELVELEQLANLAQEELRRKNKFFHLSRKERRISLNHLYILYSCYFIIH